MHDADPVGGQSYRVRLVALVDDDQDTALTQLAARAKVPRAPLVRFALRQFLEAVGQMTPEQILQIAAKEG